MGDQSPDLKGEKTWYHKIMRYVEDKGYSSPIFLVLSRKLRPVSLLISIQFCYWISPSTNNW